MQFGVYEVYNANMDVVYVGSTKLKLEWLEDNHRNWESKGYSETKFRKALVEQGKDWTFHWAIAPQKISRQQVEIMEGALIQYLKPMYNVSMKPYERSVYEGRYEKSI